RVIPSNLKPCFTFDWDVPEIFGIIQTNGRVPRDEMYRVFNMGIGIALIIKPENSESLIQFGREQGVPIFAIGRLERG
ncbi:MAG: phosphoribosylformylglycinamidine cyclo-ligase, partial [Spirochaetota bacterium]